MSLASDLPESLSEPELELDTIRLLELMAFSNSDVNCCRIPGKQQQHCQPETCTSDKHSSPMFLFMHAVQNKVLHDLQLIKSLLRPHHPQ